MLYYLHSHRWIYCYMYHYFACYCSIFQKKLSISRLNIIIICHLRINFKLAKKLESTLIGFNFCFDLHGNVLKVNYVFILGCERILHFQLYYLEESEVLAKLINYTLMDTPGVRGQEE